MKGGRELHRVKVNVYKVQDKKAYNALAQVWHKAFLTYIKHSGKFHPKSSPSDSILFLFCWAFFEKDEDERKFKIERKRKYVPTRKLNVVVSKRKSSDLNYFPIENAKDYISSGFLWLPFSASRSFKAWRHNFSSDYLTPWNRKWLFGLRIFRTWLKRMSFSVKVKM